MLYYNHKRTTSHKGLAIGKQRFLCKSCAKKLLCIFEGHIADGTLALCNGLRSYHAFPGIADCIVRDCNDPGSDDRCFYNLNAVNGFHSLIKQRYVFYRGMASKYINRYNTLFSSAYRNAEGIIKRPATPLFNLSRKTSSVSFNKLILDLYSQ